MIPPIEQIRLISARARALLKSSVIIKTKESVFINDEFICVPNLW